MTASESKAQSDIEKGPFKLNYAPHFGMFEEHAGKDLVDQLKFMADVGFKALEDNTLFRRSVEDQNKIAKTLDQLGMTLGVFIAYMEFGRPTFVQNKNNEREKILREVKKSLEIAKRVNAKWVTVVPGCIDQSMPWDYQTAYMIENLKYCAELYEPAGVVMVLEPLNHWTDHPGLFLSSIPQAYHICKAVDSPSVKVLDDLYHMQISEGNLIPNMEQAWDQIAYIQVGDNPGRKEPTTGEINYRNVFKWLHKKGYKGIVGMEHGNSRPGKAGETAVIEAYRKCDDF